MKTLHCAFYGLLLLLLTSCNSISFLSRNANPLVLKLEITQKDVHSFDGMHCQITLSNQGNTSVLIYRGWSILPFPISPNLAKMLILVSDSSGNLVPNENQILHEKFPNQASLDVLKPGEQIKQIYYLTNGFWAELFKKGEKYTIVAIYQNEFDVTKTIDDVDVSSWVGSIRSNAETFVILP